VVIHTGQFPLGFVQDTLVTTDGDRTRELELSPSPHLVKVPGVNDPLTTYPEGVVDAPLTFPSSSTADHTDTLRLTTLTGTHTVLHRYHLSGTDYRDVDEGFVSSDGKRLVVERGNHQDFGGLGPSSLADEFNLASGNTRTALGHYGSAAGQWRVATVSFQGPGDRIWAAWERAGRRKVYTVVAVHDATKWRRFAADAITVAGNTNGAVVIQPGKYVTLKPDDADAQRLVPTAEAVLLLAGKQYGMDVEGTAFVWVRP
jgi:hypothetical protein